MTRVVFIALSAPALPAVLTKVSHHRPFSLSLSPISLFPSSTRPVPYLSHSFSFSPRLSYIVSSRHSPILGTSGAARRRRQHRTNRAKRKERERERERERKSGKRRTAKGDGDEIIAKEWKKWRSGGEGGGPRENS